MILGRGCAEREESRRDAQQAESKARGRLRGCVQRQGERRDRGSRCCVERLCGGSGGWRHQRAVLRA